MIRRALTYDTIRDRLGQALLPLAMVAACALGYMGGGYQLAQWGPWALGFTVVSAHVLVIAPIDRERVSGRLRLAVLVALAAYVGWTALGARWSPNQFSAHEEVGRTALYASCVVLGLVGSRHRSGLQAAVVVWMLATCAVTAAMLVGLAGNQESLFASGRLLGTLTYHNAEAAFMLLPVPAALSLATQRRLEPGVRALLVGGSSLLAMTAVLPQSRGAMLGIVLALAVTLLVSPARVRLLLVLAPVAGSVAIVWPRLAAVYEARQAAGDVDATARVEAAVSAILGTSIVVATLVALVALADARWELPRRARRVGSVLVAGTCVVGVLALIAAVPALRSPVETVRTQWNAAASSQPTATEAGAQAGRFTQLGNASAAARIELWRVAARDARQYWLRGIGPNQYEASFYQHREQVLDRYARQPHQLTLEVVSERGVVGGALAAFVLVGILIVAIRARVASSSQRSKVLIAGLVGTCTYWLAHAQLDWIWQMASLTVPVAILAGCLLGVPWHLPVPRRDLDWARRLALVAVVALPAVIAAPLVLAERSVNRSDAAFARDDVDEALDASRHAAHWAPHWSRSWQVRADALDMEGDRVAADRAAARSVNEDPQHWAAYVWLADYYHRTGQPEMAGEARLSARKRNPLDTEIASSGR